MEENFAILSAQALLEAYEQAFANPAGIEDFTSLLAEDVTWRVGRDPDNILLANMQGIYEGIDSVGDFFSGTLTVFFPTDFEALEFLIDDPDSETPTVIARMRQSGVGTQTGRDFTTDFVFRIEFGADGLITNLETDFNGYPISASPGDGEVPNIPANDPLTGQVVAIDENLDSELSSTIAIEAWEALLNGDFATFLGFNDPETTWSFGVGGPDLLPFVGVAEDPQGILSQLWQPLRQTVEPGEFTITETFSQGNRVLVHLVEVGATAIETGEQFNLDWYSWLTINEEGLIESNQVIFDTFRAVDALRPDFTFPLAERLSRTRRAPANLDLVVGNQVNAFVATFDDTGNFLGFPLETNPFDTAEFTQPLDLTYGPDGDFYAASGITLDGEIINQVLRFDGLSGEFIDSFGEVNGEDTPELLIPSGIQFGADGNFYVASAFSSQILQFEGESGEFLQVVALRENGAEDNLLNPEENFADFNSFVFGPDGAIYVASGLTDIDSATGRPELNTDGLEDLTILDDSDGAGAILRFPGLDWQVDPNDATQVIDPVTGESVTIGEPIGLATSGTDLTEFGIYGETGGILDENSQPLVEPRAIAFGPDLNLYVASAQTGEVLVYTGPLTENPGEFLGVFANVSDDILANSDENNGLLLSGLGFGPDGNLYVSSALLTEDGAPTAGGEVSLYAGPNSQLVNPETGDIYAPGTYLGPYNDATTQISRLLLPSSPEFVFFENSYLEENNPTQRFPQIEFVVGVNSDQPTSPEGIPGFSLSDNADAVAAFDAESNFLGFLGERGLVSPEEFNLENNPIDGIGGIVLSPEGNILVTSQLSGEILEYHGLTGEFLGVFGDASGLDFPAGITIGPDNNIYVTDLGNNRVLRFDGYTGESFDDPETPLNESAVIQLPESEAGFRLTDLVFGPDGRIYVGFNPPSEAPALGQAEVRVYSPPNVQEVEATITGLDFAAAVAIGADNRLYVADDPASLGISDAPSRVLIYEIDSVHPLLTDPETGFADPEGVRQAPELVGEFAVGFGNAGGITVTENEQTGETLIYLSEPISGEINVYTITGELVDTLNPPLPSAALPENGGIDEDGQIRPTGSHFLRETIPSDPFEPISDEIIDTGVTITNTDDNLIFLDGDVGQTVNLEFSLTGVDAGFISEVGVFTIADELGTIESIIPGEPGYIETALDQSQVIFSALSSNTREAFDSELTRIISGFNSQDLLAFYLIPNSTADAVTTGDTPTEQVLFSSNFGTAGFEQTQVLNLTDSGFTLSWEDLINGGSEDESYGDLVVDVELTSENPPLGNQVQGNQELIDLRDVPGEGILAQVITTGDADTDNIGGLYIVLDEQGTIADPLTGEFLSPEAENYAAVVQSQSMVQFGTEEELLNTTLFGGFLYAPYLLADGNPDDFYSPFLTANADGLDHLRLLADNTFSFESGLNLGNGDFNDFAIQIGLETIG